MEASMQARPREHVQVDAHQQHMRERLEDAAAERGSLEEDIEAKKVRIRELTDVMRSCEAALAALEPQIKPVVDSPDYPRG